MSQGIVAVFNEESSSRILPDEISFIRPDADQSFILFGLYNVYKTSVEPEFCKTWPVVQEHGVKGVPHRINPAMVKRIFETSEDVGSSGPVTKIVFMEGGPIKVSSPYEDLAATMKEALGEDFRVVTSLTGKSVGIIKGAISEVINEDGHALIVFKSPASDRDRMPVTLSYQSVTDWMNESIPVLPERVFETT